ncbi:hypothetical protein [Marixanthomonas ophiurae]|uniref:Outer membrane protein beta-barrel domain-containing protein n=1 Tax=Marixanthomonas ophiurae TaxID=387659 RepID=A0A3E1QCF8_9FLAO|nr:hypothetical protein [Marixanthomonas ophiurae]RFN59813.1 hypothetical protein DZ858_07115 [Marixanthomonas ophiurae]
MKIGILILSFLCFGQLFSQEEAATNTFKYHSFSILPLTGFYKGLSDKYSSNYSSFRDGGIILGGDLSFSYKEKNLLTLGLSTGSDVSVFGSTGGFSQINVLYGRSLALSRVIYVEGHVGIGHISIFSNNIDTNNRGAEHKSTVGFPVMTKFRIKTGARFSLGLKLQVAINTLQPIFSTGLILQWNRRKKSK